ncbi:hypothetical protein T4B_5533 [Trichinella pseudospiralis]|uniref:Uncharacterized protein n=2 Tax=Trichinella pseudospiralis TaxID=6337 RepID=A0A0V1FHG0_TRIPS|nr:hypothetical protein T4D_1008 [Trichinella pseudospiralis]KRZ23133.1 hypothetical protein T4B_5533 [Trichinella pseudospiralis]
MQLLRSLFSSCSPANYAVGLRKRCAKLSKRGLAHRVRSLRTALRIHYTACNSRLSRQERFLSTPVEEARHSASLLPFLIEGVANPTGNHASALEYQRFHNSEFTLIKSRTMGTFCE